MRKFHVALLVLIVVFLVFAETHRGRKMKRPRGGMRRNRFRQPPRRPNQGRWGAVGMQMKRRMRGRTPFAGIHQKLKKCANVCRDDCVSMQTCKVSCQDQCSEARVSGLCMRNCFVNHCLNQNCTACQSNCFESKRECMAEHCGPRCNNKQKFKRLPPFCVKCMKRHCSQQQDDDDDVTGPGDDDFLGMGEDGDFPSLDDIEGELPSYFREFLEVLRRQPEVS